MSDHPHRPIFDAGNLVLRRRPAPRAKPRCKRDGCGHARSDHASTFAKDSNDYVYGKCTVWGCLCHACFDDIPADAAIDVAPVEAGIGSSQPCRACGAAPAHTYLGAECVAKCEENWRELERLRRAETAAISKLSPAP